MIRIIVAALLAAICACNETNKESIETAAVSDTAVRSDTVKHEKAAPEKKQKLTTSDRGINLIKEVEAFEPLPYSGHNCILIGYGCIIDLKKNPEYSKGITVEKADELLQKELRKIERVINKKVEVPLEQHEFDALVSFTYSVGIGRFSRSTLLKKINKNSPDKEIRAEFMRWQKAGGEVLPGLAIRRKKEADMFITGKYK